MNQKSSPLARLAALGQSIWLDDIRRAWLEDGTLARLVRDDAISGLTSNPAIFEKAIARSQDYDSAIADAVRQGCSGVSLYERLAIEDVQGAADVLLPVFERTQGQDGYVSLEVSPHLAQDADATVEEGLRLWRAVGRRNLMIKVPATLAGLDAIRRLLSQGINVNVTLIFGLSRYAAVTEAWLAALEERRQAGQPLQSVASVASFFLSRIDTLIDPKLDAIGSPAAQRWRGQSAIACARLAYTRWEQLMASNRWQTLAQSGAVPQRLLWASTSTKDPRYPDVKYVESLIAPYTVNTLPLETLDAYRDHGDPKVRIAEQLEDADAAPVALRALGIDLEEAAAQLEVEGLKKFVQPFDTLLAALDTRAREFTDDNSGNR